MIGFEIGDRVRVLLNDRWHVGNVSALTWDGVMVDYDDDDELLPQFPLMELVEHLDPITELGIIAE